MGNTRANTGLFSIAHSAIDNSVLAIKLALANFPLLNNNRENSNEQEQYVCFFV
jgi:hypothetical protein